MPVKLTSAPIILKSTVLVLGLCLMGLATGQFLRQPRVDFDKRRQEGSSFQIASNSMAPTLMGPHYPAQCQHCQQTWSIAAETMAESLTTNCPGCESTDCRLGRLLPGEPVTTTSGPTGESADPIRRLDCIAFTEVPQSADLSSWTCKRVWGLPGEQVALRDGQLWIDGKLFQKNLEQLRRLAVSVSKHPSDSRVHWQCRQSMADSEMKAELDRAIEAGWYWKWNYSTPLGDSSDDQQGQPVLDDYWCNSSTPRNLVAVNDLLLTIEFDACDPQFPDNERGSMLMVECHYQGLIGQVACCFGNLINQATESSNLIAGNPRRLSIGGWDGWMWAQWDSEAAVKLSSQPPPSCASSDDKRVGEQTTGFTIRATEGTTPIGCLHVQRDLYLRYNERDPRNGLPEPVRLGPDEYYVIGDNLPISRDSRNGLGTVHGHQILGKIDQQHP